MEKTPQMVGNDALFVTQVIIYFTVWWCEAVQCILSESSLLAEVICFIKSEAQFNWPAVCLVYFTKIHLWQWHCTNLYSDGDTGSLTLSKVEVGCHDATFVHHTVLSLVICGAVSAVVQIIYAVGILKLQQVVIFVSTIVFHINMR